MVERRVKWCARRRSTPFSSSGSVLRRVPFARYGVGSAEQQLQQTDAVEMVVALEVCQNCRERTDSKRLVPRNRDVVLPVAISRQTKVAARLSRRLISEPRQATSEVVA